MKRAYFDELAPRWDALPGPPDAARRARRFAAEALTAQERTILDAGCGTGLLGQAVLDICPQIRVLIECDFAHAMLLENRRKLAAASVVRLCADLAAPAIRARSLDAVLCLNVLPHLDDLDIGLTRLFGLLRPGGRFAVGHFMSSPRLNELHRTIGGPVGSDVLPAVEDMASRLRRLGARLLRAEEEDDRYLVLAEAP